MTLTVFEKSCLILGLLVGFKLSSINFISLSFSSPVCKTSSSSERSLRSSSSTVTRFYCQSLPVESFCSILRSLSFANSVSNIPISVFDNASPE
ncbi:hypothetical protein EB796_017631 [Bugula neritina]|uniref:Uncharacterized protein n=1 Tax=Bugula neritina TaxID=10212 RepID=A0A7J7JCZ5_BUGNE|nr:hypothetical protein EB796_017631 [Bugula neritina]